MSEKQLQLSPSQASMYLRCGLQWEFRYVRGIKTPPAGAMLRGSALDGACNVHYKKKAKDKKGVKNKDFVDLAVSLHDEQLGREEVVMDVSEDKSRDMTAIGAKAYHSSIGCSLQPRSAEDVQLELVKKIGGVLVLMYVDLVTEEESIIDTKFKAQFPNAEEIKRDLQLGTYSLATGIRRVGWAVVRPMGDTKLIVGDRNTQSLKAVVDTYQRVAGGIRAGVAMPALPGNWWCTAKWCGYWSICRHGGKCG